MCKLQQDRMVPKQKKHKGEFCGDRHFPLPCSKDNKDFSTFADKGKSALGREEGDDAGGGCPGVKAPREAAGPHRRG